MIGFVYGYNNKVKTLKVNLHPTNITHIVKIFSASVFGATLPNPTEVKDVNVKYSAVIYRDCKNSKNKGREKKHMQSVRRTLTALFDPEPILR